MLIDNRWFHVAAGVALSMVVAGCGGSTGSGEGGSGGTGGGTSTGGTGTGGTGTGGTATGGSGGTGGAPMSLAETGVAQDDCAPNDGPAISAYIGNPSVCNDTPNGSQQVRFLAYPAQMAMLKNGDAWDFASGNLSAAFYPDGTSGAQVAPKSGHLEVVNVVSVDQVEFSYKFTTVDDVDYAGTVTLSVCPSQGLCG